MLAGVHFGAGVEYIELRLDVYLQLRAVGFGVSLLGTEGIGLAADLGMSEEWTGG